MITLPSEVNMNVCFLKGSANMKMPYAVGISNVAKRRHFLLRLPQAPHWSVSTSLWSVPESVWMWIPPQQNQILAKLLFLSSWWSLLCIDLANKLLQPDLLATCALQTHFSLYMGGNSSRTRARCADSEIFVAAIMELGWRGRPFGIEKQNRYTTYDFWPICGDSKYHAWQLFLNCSSQMN